MVDNARFLELVESEWSEDQVKGFTSFREVKKFNDVDPRLSQVLSIFVISQ